MKKKIFMLDDDAYEMQGLVDYLKTEYDVTFMDDPEEAFEYLIESNSKDYSLFIIDIAMPKSGIFEGKKLSGVKFIELLLKDKYAEKNRIMILTILNKSRLKSSMQDLKDIRIRHKPINPSYLLDEVNRCLGE